MSGSETTTIQRNQTSHMTITGQSTAQTGYQTTQNTFTNESTVDTGYQTTQSYFNESSLPAWNQSTQIALTNESAEETGNQTGPAAIIYTLKGLNDAVAEIYYGAVFMFAILIIPGIIGNLHVLHIYIFKKPKNNTRVYVSFLAIIDLLTCVVAFPYNIINCLLPYMFYSDIACKFFTWLNGFVTMGSALSLLVIAIERYRKICTPFKTQITISYAKLSCLVVVVASTILSIPTLYLYGSTRIQTVHPAFYGYECFVQMKFRDTNFPMIYNGGVLTISASLSTSLVVLYTLIGIHLWKQQVKMRKNKTKAFKASKQSDQGEIPHISMSDNTATLNSLHTDTTTNTSVPDISSTSSNTLPGEVDDGYIYMGQDRLHVNGNLGKDMTHHFENLDKERTNPYENLDCENLDKDRPVCESPVEERPHDYIYVGEDMPNDYKTPDNGRLNVNERQVDDKPGIPCKGKPNTIIPCETKTNNENGLQSCSHANITKTVSKPDNHAPGKAMKKKPAKDDKMEQTKRNTYMFFLITLCYIFSYIPYPILRLYQIFNIDWYMALSLEGKIAFHAALCGLFINNVVNSFIYMICDRHYRQELKGIYAKLMCRK